MSLIKELQELVTNLSRILAGFPGAWIQDKGLSVSIHYRQVNPADVPRLIDVVRNAAKPSLDAQKFILRSGKMVLEIRPAVNWHKGKAVEWLAQKMSPNCTEPLKIYIGDDDTDEDVSWHGPGRLRYVSVRITTPRRITQYVIPTKFMFFYVGYGFRLKVDLGFLG